MRGILLIFCLSFVAALVYGNGSKEAFGQKIQRPTGNQQIGQIGLQSLGGNQHVQPTTGNQQISQAGFQSLGGSRGDQLVQRPTGNQQIGGSKTAGLTPDCTLSQSSGAKQSRDLQSFKNMKLLRMKRSHPDNKGTGKISLGR